MLIGDFARLGQVSVRMLRHYDHIGLLTPDSVDDWSGYRSYSPEQLFILNRIVALKDLGLSLDQVGRVLTEKENEMSADYVVKPIPAVRLAAVTDTLDPDILGERIGPMFDEVRSELEKVHANLATAIATYSEVESGMDVVVGYAYGGSPLPSLKIVDIPAATAVCGVHLGPMDSISESWMAMHRWLVDNGYEYDGPCRELYVRAESGDQHDWVTELQQPISTR